MTWPGSTRYVPGAGGGASGDTAQVGGADPFTGASSYQSSASRAPAGPTGTVHGADPFTGKCLEFLQDGVTCGVIVSTSAFLACHQC